MSAWGLTPPEFWGSVIVLCVVGLVYFGRSVLDAEHAAENQKAFKWGDKQRRANDEPMWLSHPMLAAATCLAVLFVLKVML
jgi:hypothetical protein